MQNKRASGRESTHKNWLGNSNSKIKKKAEKHRPFLFVKHIESDSPDVCALVKKIPFLTVYKETGFIIYICTRLQGKRVLVLLALVITASDT